MSQSNALLLRFIWIFSFLFRLFFLFNNFICSILMSRKGFVIKGSKMIDRLTRCCIGPTDDDDDDAGGVEVFSSTSLFDD